VEEPEKIGGVKVEERNRGEIAGLFTVGKVGGLVGELARYVVEKVGGGGEYRKCPRHRDPAVREIGYEALYGCVNLWKFTAPFVEELRKVR
jgi:hypothetical protein